MKRWFIAISIVLATIISTAAFVRAPNPRTIEPVDELLAYEVMPGYPIRIELPGDLDEILVSAWGILESTDAAVGDVFPFTLRASFRDAAGRQVLTRSYANETRFDARIKEGSSEPLFRARLMDSNEPVTDPRSMSILTEGKLPQGGSVELSLERGVFRALLVRVLRRESRAPLQQAAFLRGLDQKGREKMAAGRASLGYEDLPDPVRMRSVSSWGRRLEAIGKEGVDYRVRRLLLGNATQAAQQAAASAGFPIGPRHAAAFNFEGPVEIRIETSAPTTLERLRGNETKTLAMQGTTFTIADDDPKPRTIAFRSTTDVLARFIVNDSASRGLIGEETPFPHPSGWEISPDVRMFRHAVLHPDKPVRYRVADGPLRINCRASLLENEEEKKAVVTVRFPGSKAAPHVAELTLPRSPFDRFRNGPDATDAQSAIIRTPEGTSAIELVGPTHAQCFVQVLDPTILRDELEVPYRVALRPDEHWVHAPYDIRRFATILPENLEELDAAQRWLVMRGIVRIQSVSPGGPGSSGTGAKPEMPVDPVGQPIQRHLLEPAFLGRALPLPGDALVRLDKPTKLTISGKGPRARKLEVAYVVPSSSLGQTLRLEASGKEVASERIIATGGRLRASNLDEGSQSVTITGTSGAFFADAPPTEGGLIYRKRTFFELPLEREIYFRFPQPEGVRLTAWVITATDQLKDSWRIRYWLSGGSERKGVFVQGLTAPTGVILGKNAEQGGGIFLEGDPSALISGGLRQGIGKAKIRLYDDRSGGLRELRLRVEDPTRVWVRLIVVGENTGKVTRETAWVADED